MFALLNIFISFYVHLHNWFVYFVELLRVCSVRACMLVFLCGCPCVYVFGLFTGICLCCVCARACVCVQFISIMIFSYSFSSSYSVSFTNFSVVNAVIEYISEDYSYIEMDFCSGYLNTENYKGQSGNCICSSATILLHQTFVFIH